MRSWILLVFTLVDCFKLYAFDRKYDPFTWPVAAILDAALIPHFPCKRNCSKSIEIANSRLNILFQNGQDSDINRMKKALTYQYSLSNNEIIYVNKLNL